MAYAFKQSSGVADQVRAIAVEQIDKALQAVVGNDNFDTTVHTLRKCAKKLRAVLKLVRPAFEDYESESAAIKAIVVRSPSIASSPEGILASIQFARTARF